MDKMEFPDIVDPLQMDFWGASTGLRRSRELTPLYVQRYAGPRTKPRSPTVHAHWELTYVFKGTGFLRTSKTHLLSQDVVVLVPPGLTHSEDATDPMDTLWVGFHTYGIDDEALKDAAIPDIVRVKCPNARELCSRLWQIAERHAKGSGPELDGLTHALVATVLRAHHHAATRTTSTIEVVIDHIRENLNQPLSIRLLAGRAGYSERHFHREFKKLTGVSPRQFVERLRMQAALNYLRKSRLPVARIARMVGYDDPLYFSRAFKRVTGQSPEAFRGRFSGH